jgi:hypothetical protein
MWTRFDCSWLFWMSSRDVNGFGFSLYLSTSKLYKCMQHTSGPTGMWNEHTYLVQFNLFFFRYRFCFTKCACSLEQVRVMPSHVRFGVAGVSGLDEGWALVLLSGKLNLIGYFSYSLRCRREIWATDVFCFSKKSRQRRNEMNQIITFASSIFYIFFIHFFFSKSWTFGLCFWISK